MRERSQCGDDGASTCAWCRVVVSGKAPDVKVAIPSMTPYVLCRRCARRAIPFVEATRFHEVPLPV